MQQNEVRYRVKNWEKFQHYRDRKPTWIKLYRELLDDPDWHELDGDASKVLAMCWLVASEDEFGWLPPIKTLAFRLRMTQNKLQQALMNLKNWLVQDDIEPLAGCYQSASLEREKEKEKEEEKEKNISSEVPSETSEPTDAFEKSILDFPCNGKPTTWPLTQSWIDQHQPLFPGLDVLKACREAFAWAINNPTKRKTFRGMGAFLSRWITRANDSNFHRQPVNGHRKLSINESVEKVAREMGLMQ
jgi:hypothetical protein